MPRRLARTSDVDARQHILDVAAQVFADNGFAGARIDLIAEKASVNKAMLYYHVGDKERLYAAVLIETVERGLASVEEAATAAGTPSEKLEAIAGALAAFGSSNPVFVPIMLREVASGGRTLPDEMLLRMAGIFRVVAEVLASGVSQGVFRQTDPLLTHVTLVGSLMFLVASQPVRERLARAAGLPPTAHDPGAIASHIANLFLHGLETAPSPGSRARLKASPRPPRRRS